MSGMLEHEDGASKLDPGSGAFALLRQNPAADDSLDSTRLDSYPGPQKPAHTLTWFWI